MFTLFVHSIHVKVISAFFFFFQAEDGIRDVAVTGVQTCALPIWPGSPPRADRLPSRRRTTAPSSPPAERPARRSRRPADPPRSDSRRTATTPVQTRRARPPRSEERRVGKECRSRWAQYQ